MAKTLHPDALCALEYAEEHFVCENYMLGTKGVLGFLERSRGQLLVRDSVVRSSLLFVLSGRFKVYAQGGYMPLSGGQVTMIAAGDSFYAEAEEDSLLLYCAFDRNMPLCHKFTLETLAGFLPKMAGRQTAVLPVKPLLLRYLRLTSDILHERLFCVHYQRITVETVFLLLRGFYTKEELALLFRPVLGKGFDFRDQVQRHYSVWNTVKELAAAMGMSLATFNRKFLDAFGKPAGQWLLEKKKECILRDLLATKDTVADLADKYRMSPNYFSAFCKENFGRSPSDIRNRE